MQREQVEIAGRNQLLALGPGGHADGLDHFHAEGFDNGPHGLPVAAARKIASRLRSTSDSVVAHEETLMRMATWFCHTVPPHQQVPSCCTRSMTRRVCVASPQDTRNWLSTTSFNTCQPAS